MTLEDFVLIEKRRISAAIPGRDSLGVFDMKYDNDEKVYYIECFDKLQQKY